MQHDIRNRSGFTLIELLVVVAIIGLLTSVILISLGNARLKSRDAKRLSDIQQIKSGLELYYTNGFGYPETTAWNSAQSSGSVLSCSGQQILRVPQDPANNANPSYAYIYTHGGNTSAGCGGVTYTNYKVQFETEGSTGLGSAGTYYLSPSGISTSAPF